MYFFLVCKTVSLQRVGLAVLYILFSFAHIVAINSVIRMLYHYIKWFIFKNSHHWKWTYTALNIKFSIKDFFSKCDQIRSFLADLVTFTKEILNGKLYILYSVIFIFMLFWTLCFNLERSNERSSHQRCSV